MPQVTTNLQLGIHLCQTSNCKTIKFSETTGEYNSSSNPGGWSVPESVTNPDPANVTSFSVAFTLPDSTVTTFTNTNPLFSGFPDETGTQEVSLTMADFGGSATSAFADGIYSIVYTVNGEINSGADTYIATVTQTFFLTCQIRCCIDKMFHLASQADCTDCKPEKLNNALEAESYLKAAEFAAACGKIEMAKKHLAKAQWICNTKNCLNC
jgi:hypothetical protein